MLIKHPDLTNEWNRLKYSAEVLSTSPGLILRVSLYTLKDNNFIDRGYWQRLGSLCWPVVSIMYRTHINSHYAENENLRALSSWDNG